MELLTNILLFVSFILFLLFVLGLISPKRFLPGAEAKRRGAFILYLLPSFVLFVAVGALTPNPAEEYLDDPTTTYINLDGKHLDELPEGYEVFTELTELDLGDNEFDKVPSVIASYSKLEVLDLTDNEISHIPMDLKGLTNLKTLRLGRNPIVMLPPWLAEMESLETLEVNNSLLSEIPSGIRARMEEGSLTVAYEETLAYEADFPSESASEEEEEVADADEGSTDSDDGDHTESFGEYAWRNLLGRGDLGHRLKFGESEVYYDDPVEKADADSLGTFLEDMGLFADDNEASVQLVANKKRTRFGVLMVTVYEEAEEIDEEIKSACLLYAMLYAAKMGDNVAVDWHICDDDLDILATVASDMDVDK